MRHCAKNVMMFLTALVLTLGMMIFLTGTAMADENVNMWFGIGENGFDIRGKFGTAYISTTFPGYEAGKGYYTMMQVEDNDILTFEEFDFNKVYECEGVKAFVSASLNNNAVQIEYHIENESNSEKTIKIGSCTDTMIDADDNARVRLQTKDGKTGIRMNDGTFVFWVLPGDKSAFTTRWSGMYNDNEDYYYNHVFEDGNSDIDTDSALAWSWTVRLGAGESITKTAIVCECYMQEDNAEYIDPNKYGIAKITVVDSLDEEPIKDARIEITLSEKKKEIMTTDENGNASIALPTGKYRMEVFANGKRPRTLSITITKGRCELPPIGMSDRDIIDTQLEATEMTLEEIEEAGIDINAPGNNHVYKYEVHLEFSASIDILNMFTYVNTNGDIIGGDVDYSGNWTYEPHGQYFHNEADEITVYPVSEQFYIIVYGEVRWLKEMFDVELLVINNSMTDTLTQCSATIDIPKGLGLAVMKDTVQQKSIEIGEIAGGSSRSVHWYLCGDEEGNYRPSVHLTGLLQPFKETIDRVYEVKEPLSVLGGSAMHLTYTVPDAAYYGKDYVVRAELENVSDKTLYNVESLITGIEEGKITHYSDGKTVKEVYIKSDEIIGSESAVEFEPGDKIIIEITIPILFESEIIQNMKDQMEKGVLMADQMMKAWKAYNTGAGLLSELGGYMKVYDSVTGRVMKRIDGNLDALDALTGTDKDIKSLSKMRKYIKYMGKKDKKARDEEFSIVQGVCNVIQSIPVRFDLIDAYVDVIPGSTAMIPTTINTVHVQGDKWAVNPGKYLLDLIIALYGQSPDTILPWPLSEIEAETIRDAMGYTRAVNNLKAVDGQLESISLFTPNPDILCKAWTEKSNVSISVRGASSMNQDKLQFCGNTILDFVPLNGQDDTIYIDFGNGDVRKFNIDVSPAHEHSFEKRYVLLNPTETTRGIEIGFCDICGDVVDVIETKKCKKHQYEDWVVEITPTSEYSGIRSHVCQKCHAVEYEAFPYDGFSFGAKQMTVLPGMEINMAVSDTETGIMDSHLFKWTSSDSKVASVKNGTLKTKKKGKTEISICFEDEGVELLTCEIIVKKLKTLTLPKSTQNIESEAFKGNTCIECIDLRPCEGITIAPNALKGCTNLKLLLLPEKYTYKGVLPNSDALMVSGNNVASSKATRHAAALARPGNEGEIIGCDQEDFTQHSDEGVLSDTIEVNYDTILEDEYEETVNRE